MNPMAEFGIFWLKIVLVGGSAVVLCFLVWYLIERRRER